MILLGLIGKELLHSYSKEWFTQQFFEQNIDGAYQNFELSKIRDIRPLTASLSNLKGFNVTIPYKESIIPFLDEISEEAKQIGAVNTVRIERIKKEIILHGYNTDIYGFEQTLIKRNINSNQALVFGNGGAAQAVKFVLKKRNINYKTVTRNQGDFTYNQITEQIIGKFKLLINTTPVGMYPNVDEVLPIPTMGISDSHTLIDLIYNPTITSFLKMGINRNAKTINGLLMLHEQAKKSMEIFISQWIVPK